MACWAFQLSCVALMEVFSEEMVQIPVESDCSDERL
jgi:hypothetical protein